MPEVTQYTADRRDKKKLFHPEQIRNALVADL